MRAKLTRNKDGEYLLVVPAGLCKQLDWKVDDKVEIVVFQAKNGSKQLLITKPRVQNPEYNTNVP